MIAHHADVRPCDREDTVGYRLIDTTVSSISPGRSVGRGTDCSLGSSVDGNDGVAGKEGSEMSLPEGKESTVDTTLNHHCLLFRIFLHSKNKSEPEILKFTRQSEVFSKVSHNAKLGRSVLHELHLSVSCLL